MLSFGRRAFVSALFVSSVFVGITGDAAAQPSSFTGRRLGKNRYGEEVKVTREVGNGFTDRWQAIAAARLTGSEAVLVKTRDGKLHALATTANAFGGLTPADDSEVREIMPLASPKNAVSPKGGNVDEPFAALALGLEAKEVNITFRQENRLAGVVNVNAGLPASIGGTHGAIGAKDEDFRLNAATAIEINRALFLKNDPRVPAAAFFHETVHHADYELAQRWVKKYIETKRIDSKLFDGKRDRAFLPWLLEQKGLSDADAATISDVAAKVPGATEARAYVRTFIAASQAGAFDIARDTLRVYAQRIASQQPPTGDYVPAALRAEMNAAYQSLDANGQRQFKSALIEAQKGAPSSWITRFELGSSRRS